MIIVIYRHYTTLCFKAYLDDVLTHLKRKTKAMTGLKYSFITLILPTYERPYCFRISELNIQVIPNTEKNMAITFMVTQLLNN